jgi:hypothetical protein
MDNDAGESSLVVAHRCWNDAEADIICSFLSSHGIEAVTSSRITHSVWPGMADGLGEVRILVKDSQVEETRRLVAQCDAEIHEEETDPDGGNAQ